VEVAVAAGHEAEVIETKNHLAECIYYPD